MSDVNDFLAGGYPAPILLQERPLLVFVAPNLNLKQTAIATTALTTVVDITGKGVVDFLELYHSNTTARTLTLIITIDGVEVLNQSETSGGSLASSIQAIGISQESGTSGSSDVGLFSFEPIGHRSSLKIEVQTTVSSNTFLRYNRFDT